MLHRRNASPTTHRKPSMLHIGQVFRWAVPWGWAGVARQRAPCVRARRRRVVPCYSCFHAGVMCARSHLCGGHLPCMKPCACITVSTWQCCHHSIVSFVRRRVELGVLATHKARRRGAWPAASELGAPDRQFRVAVARTHQLTAARCVPAAIECRLPAVAPLRWARPSRSGPTCARAPALAPIAVQLWLCLHCGMFCRGGRHARRLMGLHIVLVRSDGTHERNTRRVAPLLTHSARYTAQALQNAPFYSMHCDPGLMLVHVQGKPGTERLFACACMSSYDNPSPAALNRCLRSDE